MKTGSSGRPPVPRLHVLTNDRVLADPVFESRARDLLAAIGAGVAVHLRGPGTSARHLWDLGCSLGPAATDSGALLVVNDRVDVAMALLGRAAEGTPLGIHLAGRSLPAADVRALVGPTPLLGRSIHRAGETSDAGLDYLVAGTVYRTPSHPGREPDGPDQLARVVAGSSLPVLGVGGVTPARAAELRALGAHGIAVIRGVWDASDPVDAARRYLAALDTNGGSRP